MPMFPWRIMIVFLTVLAALLPLGCDRQQPETPSTKVHQPAPLRIVSLAPALSGMLVDLDLADCLVGISEHDAAAPPGLPVVGTFMDVNTEKIHALKPTHVLMMTGRGGVPDSLQALAKTMGFVLVGYAYPNDVSAVRAIIADEPGRSSGAADGSTASPPGLGTVLGIAERAEALSSRLLLQLEALGRVTKSSARPRVLLAFSFYPNVMASGPGTMLDSVLPYVGAVNAAAEATSTAPTFDREKLLANDPEVVLLLLPGNPPLQALAEDSRLAIFRGLDIAAVRDERIGLVSDPLVLLPGSSVARGAAAMAKAIHPELAEQIDHAMATAAASAGKAATTPSTHAPD